MRSLVVAAGLIGILIPFPALAQKIGVVVLSANARQGPMAGKIAEAIEENLARSRDLYHWRDLSASKAAALGTEATLKLKIQDTLTVLRSNDGARAPLPDLQVAMRAAAPIAATADIQAAQAAAGAIAWILGDIPTSEQRLVEALSYDPSMHPMEVAEPPGFAELWERARFAVNDHARGELSITSEPSGARVLVDGVFRGTTPVVAQGLTAGPHLVQLDLFGYALAGEIVKVSGPEAPVSLRLGPSELITEADLRNAIIAASQNDNGKLISELGQKIDLNNMVVGWLNPKGSSLVLSLAAVRVDNGHVLASQDLAIDTDDYGQAGPRAASLSNSLLEGKTGGIKNGKKKESKPKDPLDGKDGTEDWQ